MALVIDLDSVTPDQARDIKKALLVVPKTPVFNIRNKGKFAVKPPNPVRAYVIEKDDANRDVLRLPFTFGVRFFLKSNDWRQYPSVYIKSTFELYDYQKEVVKKVFEDFQTGRCAVIKLRPGKGKTRMSIAVSGHLSKLTCVLLPIDLCDQWKKEYLDACPGVNVWIVGQPSPLGGKCDVIICLYTRTKQIPSALRAQICLLVIDEAHRMCNQTGMDALLDFSPKYILACTATYHRSRDEMHRLMNAVVGLKHITMENDKMDFSVIKYETGIVAERVNNKRGTVDWTTLVQSLLYNPARNEIIFEMAVKLLAGGRKIMLTTSEVQHVNDLYQMFNSRGVKCDYRTRNKRTVHDTNLLISNIQLSGTGFDPRVSILDFKGRKIDTILQVSSIATPEMAEQIWGRSFRSDTPMLFYLLDSDPTCAKHWNSMAKKWCKENGATIYEVQRQSTYYRPDGTPIVVDGSIVDKYIAMCPNKAISGPGAVLTEGSNSSSAIGELPENEYILEEIKADIQGPSCSTDVGNATVGLPQDEQVISFSDWNFEVVDG